MSLRAGAIAISGANGRLGSALRELLEARRAAARAANRAAGATAPEADEPAYADVLAWTRAELDLDHPETAEAAVARDRPRLVLHCAAWTDVDGCARRPELALRRNGTATGILARACATAGAGLVIVSTNEVFDGRRTDGLGYREDDVTAPPNPYGVSKLAGERAALDAWDRAGRRRAAEAGAAQPTRAAEPGAAGRRRAAEAGAAEAAAAEAGATEGDAGRTDGLWIVRTSWLFGPPGADFPAKIVAAADRLPPGEPLPVVADETGSPTLAADLAAAIVALVEASAGGTFHLVNAGFATRFDWAREILTRVRPDRPLRAIDSTAFSRPSTPPRWGVLDTSRAASLGIRLRPWQEALAETLAEAGAAAEAGPEAGAEAGPGAGAGAGAEAGPGAGARTP